MGWFSLLHLSLWPVDWVVVTEKVWITHGRVPGVLSIVRPGLVRDKGGWGLGTWSLKKKAWAEGTQPDKEGQRPRRVWGLRGPVLIWDQEIPNKGQAKVICKAWAWLWGQLEITGLAPKVTMACLRGSTLMGWGQRSKKHQLISHFSPYGQPPLHLCNINSWQVRDRRHRRPGNKGRLVWPLGVPESREGRIPESVTVWIILNLKCS